MIVSNHETDFSEVMPMSAEEMVKDGAKPINDACEFTGLGRTELYKLMGSGELAFVKHGKRRLIPTAELKRILADRIVGGQTKTAIAG